MNMASFSRDRDTNIGAVAARRTCLASSLRAPRVTRPARGWHTRAGRIEADNPVSRPTASPYAGARMNAVPARTAT